ncbi:MAG: hypothetical protein DI606_16970 [Sphingobium sp.]|uniref:hypothetical protein n=1 Tax=Sphingobium sp. TaxID=1912891 RepID=UPI000DB14241|nr:hypothetical protein [Sphingobium sp.]PZU07314.1 MAG: hypothetical protein DI606_16970 [Sphingobium sp.]
MSASRLAIMAGLLTLALAAGSAPAARKDRAIEAEAPPQKLSIAQVGADFFIGEPRAATPPNQAVNLGSTVRIDQRLLTSGMHSSAGDKQ